MQKLIPYKILPDKDDPIIIGEISSTYVQERDCCQSSNEDDYQELKIHLENGGGGPFIVFETKRWAISNLDELNKIFNDFLSRTNALNLRKKL